MKKNYVLCLLLLICMAAFSQTKSNNDGYVSPFEIIEKDLQLGATESEFYVGYERNLILAIMEIIWMIYTLYGIILP